MRASLLGGVMLNWKWLAAVVCILAVGIWLEFAFDGLDKETIFIPLVQTAVGVIIGTAVLCCVRKLSKQPITNGSRAKAALLSGFLAGITGIVTGYILAARIVCADSYCDQAILVVLFDTLIFGAYSAVVGALFGAGVGQPPKQSENRN